MSEETIKTGIYLNPTNNRLYFVVGLIDNKDTDTKSVHYFSLYESSDGCCRSLSNFFEKELLSGEKVTRMRLLQELKPELKDKMAVGSIFYGPERCEVLGIIYDGEKIYAQLIRGHDSKEIKMSMRDFMIWLRM